MGSSPDRLVALVHAAMRDAPHDGRDFRQARAAIAATRAEDMAAMLREVEWFDHRCPICKEWEAVHTSDCKLAALLKELPSG